jgi:hypothetical protein
MTFDWFVGLFEGEGYISARKTTPHLFVLGITSTDKDVIERVISIVGGKLYGPYVKQNGRIKDQWTWYLSHKKDSIPLLERMVPLLCSRRKARALEALEAWKNRPEPKPRPRRGPYRKRGTKNHAV